ncbi:hypothetical protein JCM33374_g1803 [Metschnikowia sp. JCM 33374]|nr:hypothetical protein JCM33374_g1803 [Metschnikowia sp. JCM 33374]
MKFISTFVFVSVAVAISIKDLGRDNTSPRSVQEIEDESIKDGTMVFSGDEDFVNTKSFYQDDSEKIALNQNFFSQLGHSGLVKMTKRDPVDPSQNPRQSVETRIQILFDKMKPFKADVAVNPRKLETLYPKLKNELLQLNDEIEQTIENGSRLTEEQLSQFTDLSTIFEMMELNSEMRNAGCVDQMSLIFGSEPRKTKLIDVMEKFDRFSDHLSECYDDDKNPKILDPHFETLVQSCISDLGNLKEESKDFINQDTPLSTVFNEELADIQIEIDTLKDLTGARTATPIHSTNTGNSQGSSQFQEEKSLSEAEKAQQHELEELETKLRSAFTGNYQNEGSSDLQNSLEWRKRLQKACDEGIFETCNHRVPRLPQKERYRGAFKGKYP